MNILVTGAAGFIGSRVACHLVADGHNVIGLDNLSTGHVRNVTDGVTLIEGDYGNAQLLEPLMRAYAFDAVFHLGAFAAECLSPFAPTFTHQNNTVGTATLLATSVRHRVGLFVFTSSIAVYGDQTPPFTEGKPLHPVDCYGASKACSESDIRAMSRFGLRHVIFRPFNVYGGGQSLCDPFRNVVGIFARHALLGKPMPVYGDGLQVRAFSHISEVAPVIASSLHLPWSGTYNVGSARCHTIVSMAAAVATAFGVRLELEHLPGRHEVREAYADVSKVRHEFPKLTAPVDLHDGLAEMVDVVRRHGPSCLEPVGRFRHGEISSGLPPSWIEHVTGPYGF